MADYGIDLERRDRIGWLITVLIWREETALES